MKAKMGSVFLKIWESKNVWVWSFEQFQNIQIQFFQKASKNWRISQNNQQFYRRLSNQTSEIFWERCLYMRISSQILRTIVVYQKLVIWIFANHGYIPENPPWEPLVIIFHFWQPPNTGKDLFPLKLVSGVS